MLNRNLIARRALVVVAMLGNLAAAGEAPLAGRAEFIDRRDPPARRALDANTRADFELGLLVFNTPWVEAGSTGAARRDGLGPLFISASCDACHNNGARGRPPAESGGLSNSFVMQLSGAEGLYGAVLNTSALPDHSREGRIEVSWTTRHGSHADGTAWELRVPHYRLTNLLYGPPPPGAVLRPRMAPQVYGAGMLEAVPAAALQALRRRQPRAQRGALPAGHFGWLGDALHVEDQTARAFAREMGLTSGLRPRDDCTETQIACRRAPQGGTPEVSAEFMRATLTFQRELAAPPRGKLGAQEEMAGRQLFRATGCATCHVESLPSELDGQVIRIDAFSDLLLHDLGPALSDRRQDGRIVKTRWRTAPLWGLAQARRFNEIALLHDGRAASVEEAILWHGGQAEGAARAFSQLPATQRATLVAWVESL
jgi:CxxC motif-containing protein (DUF1111 family)